MKKFTYTKDDGTTSDRILHITTKPSNAQALDLTKLSPEDAAAAVRLYEIWNDEVYKPYKKTEDAFRKANLQTFEAYLKENGLDITVESKSFKPAGLVEVV